MAFLRVLFGNDGLFSALQNALSSDEAGESGQALREVTTANYGSIKASETAPAPTVTASPSVKPRLWSQLDAVYNRDINWELAGKPLDNNIPPVDQWPAHDVQPLLTLVENDHPDQLLFDYKQFRFSYDATAEQLSIQSTELVTLSTLPVSTKCRQSLVAKTGMFIMLFETFLMTGKNSNDITHFNELITRAVKLGYTASPLLHCLATALHPAKDSHCPALFISRDRDLVSNYYPNVNAYNIIDNLEGLATWLESLEGLDKKDNAPCSEEPWAELAPIARMFNSIPSAGNNLLKKALCRTIMSQRYHVENKVIDDEFLTVARRSQYWELTLDLPAGSKQFIYLSPQQAIPPSLCAHKLLRSFDELYDEVLEALSQSPTNGLRR